jgi:RNA polymerase sigma factor (sigma-70 family)
MKGGETMSDNISIRDKLVQDFVDNYMEKIFYFCLKKTNNRLDAEDLTQDIALNVIDGLNKGTIPNNYSAWVWQIARNVYSKWATIKRIRRENINSIDVYDVEIEYEGKSIIDEMIYDEQLALLRRELAFIKSEYRNIIVAYYLENKSIKDIANSLNLSVDAIHQRLHRARNVLKEGMSMTRTFGKRSYSPENIAFVMNGRDGKKGQPWSIITHLIYKNIFLEAYENPQTAEQLALELGIALPYMEDELEFLCREELLRKIGNKYETNFKILSKEEQLKQYEINTKVSKQITTKLCKMIDLYIKEDTKKVNYEYIGYENAKWTLLVKSFDALLLETRKGEFENSPVSYKDDMPQRPDDGAWTLTGYERPVDFNVPYFVGLHGYNYKDKKEIKIDIHYGQYKFYAKDLYNKTPQLINYNDAYTLWLVCNGKINECEKGYIDQLIQYGYLKKDNNVIKPNVLIFNKCISIDKNNEILTNLKNEIIELLKECSGIKRGYIVDQALEDGWLKFDDDTINTVGAFIYK